MAMLGEDPNWRMHADSCGPIRLCLRLDSVRMSLVPNSVLIASDGGCTGDEVSFLQQVVVRQSLQ
jgi:hypothetical protein